MLAEVFLRVWNSHTDFVCSSHESQLIANVGFP